MSRFLPAAAVAILALPATAQTEAPRIDTPDAADASVTINELNTDDYPDVRVIATVTEGGTPVTGLVATDFRVREDEVDQSPLTVEEQLPPLSVVVTIDTSGSMSDAMAATQDAASTFVEGLDEADSVQILPFAETTDPATAMTSDRAEATQAIAGLTARGDTALFDALAASVDLLAERRGRKAIVVLSDGVDDNGAGEPLSTATLDDVLTAAATVSVPVFAIGLGTEMDEAVLSRLATETGALYLNAPDAAQLSGVYGQIGAQLTGQYSIRYTSSLPADGTERRVDLDAPGGQASKSYTPAGNAPARVPESTGCTTADALVAARPALEESASLHEDGLISNTDRNSDLSNLTQPAKDAANGATENYECLVSAMAALKSLHDDELVTSVTVNAIRSDLADAIGRKCEGESDLSAIEACFELFAKAHRDEILTSVNLNALRATAKEPLITALRAMDDPRAALETVDDLHERELITSVDVNRLRREIRSR